MHDLRRQSRTFDTEKLSSAKVAIFGDGPVSNFLCAYLSGLGIGKIALIGDSIRKRREVKEPLSELAKNMNMNPKVKNIAETAGRINPDLRLLSYFSMLHRIFVQDYPIIVDATNDPESKYKAYRYCKDMKGLLISCSSSDSSASIMAHHFGKQGSTPIEDILMKEFAGRGQGSFTSGIAAVLAADEIRKEICPIDADQRLEEKLSYSILSQRRLFKGRAQRRIASQQDKEKKMLSNTRGKRALVVGAGGIGTYTLLNLMMLDMHIDIYDHDSVESHNLNRQIIHFGAVGRNKAEEAASKLSRISRRTRIRGFAKKVTSRLLKEISRRGERYDAVFSCVDNWECRQALDNYCRHTGTPLFNGSVTTFECSIDYFIPGETHCLECSNNYRERIKIAGSSRLSCADLEANVVMPNAMAGALMVAESMRIFSPDDVPPLDNKNIKYYSKAGASTKLLLENRRMLCSSKKYYRNGCRCHPYLEKN